MKTYLLTLIAASALTAGVLYLASGKKFEKHVRYISSLLLLCAILAPLPMLAEKEIPSLFDIPTESSDKDSALYDEAMVKAFKQGAEEELAALIKKKCGLNNEDFDLSLSVSCVDRRLSIDSVRIVLKNLRAVLERENARQCVEELCERIEFVEFSDTGEA